MLNSLKGSGGGSSGNPTPQPLRLRGKTQPTRPRPKTIHIDSGASSAGVDTHDGMLTSSRGKKGSSSNLSGQYILYLAHTGTRLENNNLYLCYFNPFTGFTLFLLCYYSVTLFKNFFYNLIYFDVFWFIKVLYLSCKN